ncbi:hypothetical protein AB0F77_34705 [Streptomyces sp. NPDC026672]|uniref:hypothetical protein n=1 Tax=unclassified Streptomyces TaxID=2593676 RepID=UPI0033EDFF6A
MTRDLTPPSVPASSPDPGTAAQTDLDSFVALAATDPTVVGLVLSGSQARVGMPTIHSDYDIYVVTQDCSPTALDQLRALQSSHLDLAIMPLADFRAHALPGNPHDWDRYAFVHCRVLFDRLGGLVTDLVREKASLRPDEAWEMADRLLDAYLNAYYRSMKSHRDARPEAAHLDAAEGLPYLLTLIFALHERVRPYNKYLRWELERYPLGPPQWAADRLMPQIQRIAADGDPHTQKTLFADLMQAARQGGHTSMLDSWESHLEQLGG